MAAEPPPHPHSASRQRRRCLGTARSQLARSLLRVIAATCLAGVSAALDAGAYDLPGGVQLPFVGLGTGGMSETVAEETVKKALQLGYRHIDTSENYKNEAGIGRAITSSEVPRNSLVITTKFYGGCTWGTPGAVLTSLRASLARLRLSYVDLYLMHVPGIRSGDRKRGCPKAPASGPELRKLVWDEMLQARKLGLTRAVGVANFNLRHLKRLVATTDTPPAVNQIEFQPYYHDDALHEYCRVHNVRVIAYGSLLKPGISPMYAAHRTSGQARSRGLQQVASSHGATVISTALSWMIARGVAMIPRSTSADHLAENLAVARRPITLLANETAVIDALQNVARKQGYLKLWQDLEKMP